MGKELAMKSNPYLVRVIAFTNKLMHNVECKLNEKNKNKRMQVCVNNWCPKKKVTKLFYCVLT